MQSSAPSVPPSWRRSAYAGLAAPVTLAVLTVVLGALTPGYSHARHAISRLAARGTPFGALMSYGGFVTVGILLACFAIALYHSQRPGLPSLASSALLTATGISLVVAGVFRCDLGCDLSNASTAMLIHIAAASAGLWTASLAPLALGTRIRAIRPDSWYSLLSFVTGLSLLFLVLSIMAVGGPAAPHIGTLEHLFFAIFGAWVVVSATRALAVF